MEVMAKKKPNSGKHKTERKPMQMPMDWYATIRRQAAKTATPALWYLIRLVKADCEKDGVTDLPSVPWEEGIDPPPK